MCKLLGFSVSEKVSEEKLSEVIQTCRDLLKDQKDGFGYALAGGDIKGITSLRLTTGSLLGYGYPEAGDWKGLTDQPYEAKGKISPCTAGIFHGRTSTNSLGVENTHPFVSDDLALAHNGIVDYSGKKRSKRGVCDSEDLFNTFTIGKGWRELSKHYSGYAGLLILRSGGALTIYRDSTPNLHICLVSGGIVVGTTLHDVTKLASVFDKVPNAPWMLKPDFATTIECGKITDKEAVKPMSSRSFGAKDSKSLGSSGYLGYSGYSGYGSISRGQEKELFPDYEVTPSVDVNSEAWEDGYQAGYDDGLKGYTHTILSADRNYKAGYNEGYKDGESEKSIPSETAGEVCL
jgi:hypothetical protein